MKSYRLTPALLMTAAVLTACDEPVVPSPQSAATKRPAVTSAPVSVSVPAAATTPSPAQHDALRLRLLALDYYAAQMWDVAQPDAPEAWLETTAQEHGVRLSRMIPQALATAQSVATRGFRLQAQGEWEDLVQWLTAVENAPRRFVARDIALHRLRGRSVADLHLIALLDRPAALQAVGETDLTALDASGVDDLMAKIDADLKGKSQTVERLGADVSWAQPIAAVNGHLPEAAEVIRLKLDRGTSRGRVQYFTGAFTAQVREPGEVTAMLAELNAREDFARAELTHGRDVGAGFHRAEVSFTFGQPGDSPAAGETNASPVADDSGAGLLRNPFWGPQRSAPVRVATSRARGAGHVLVGDAGGRRGVGSGSRRAASRTGTIGQGPRTARSLRTSRIGQSRNRSRFNRSTSSVRDRARGVRSRGVRSRGPSRR